MIDEQLTRRFELLKGSSHADHFKGALTRLIEADDPQEQAHHYSVLHTILSTFKTDEAHES